jgi:hypothetical protein
MTRGSLSMRIAICTTVIVAASGFAQAPVATTSTAQTPTTLHVPAADRRGEEQTYLTFPEWFLVFSPAEYAQMLRARPSSEFPWFGHVGQFWDAYRHVFRATRKYPFNREYHTMISVIGVSTTLEYGLKGSYETLIGRLTELTTTTNATPEDRLAAKQAQDYVDFIRVRPWYEFDFIAPLRALWSETPWWGPHALRKWERRYLLTSEWAIKAGYAWLLEKATHSSFDLPSDETLVVVQGMPENIDAALPALRRIKQTDGLSLIAIPRYQAFTGYAQLLARRGTQFVEIAGNRGPILTSQIARSTSSVPSGATILFRQPIVTRPGYERRIVEIRINRLSGVIREQDIEHVFDF